MACRPSRCAGVLVALVLAACDGDSKPAAPTRLRMAPMELDKVMLSWDPPPGSVIAYQVEMRVEDGPWSPLDREVSGEALGVYIGIAPEVPEVVTLFARVRARTAAGLSPDSAEASIFRGLRPVASATAAVEGIERVRLDLVQGSTASPRVEVERLLQSDIPFTLPVPVVAATLEPAVATWLDTADMAGRSVEYQLRNVASYRGARVESSPISVGPGQQLGVSPPTGLVVTVSGGTATLAWTNHSQIATAVRIERAPGLLGSQGLAFEPPFLPVATLPADATTWAEPLAEGAYTYRAVALARQFPGPSPSAQAAVSPAGFGASIVAAPQGAHGLRDGGGALWVDGMGVPAGVRVWAPTATGWTRHTLSQGRAVAEPGVLVDAAGAPHYLYQRAVDFPGTPAPVDLVHAWHDGAAWQEEVVARRTLDSESPPFLALDAGGTFHAAWKEWAAGFPELASRGTAGWTVARLDSALYASDLAYRLDGFGAAPDGSLRLLVDSSSRAVLQSRPAGGAWEEELVPGTDKVGYLEAARLVLLDGGATVFYRYPVVVSGHSSTGIAAIAKAGSSWGAPVELGRYGSAGGNQPWAAVSQGGRLATLVTQGLPEGLWLYRWDAVSGASATRLGQATAWDPAWMGFTAAGKLWVMAPAGTRLGEAEEEAGQLRAYLSLEEP